MGGWKGFCLGFLFSVSEPRLRLGYVAGGDGDVGLHNYKRYNNNQLFFRLVVLMMIVINCVFREDGDPASRRMGSSRLTNLVSPAPAKSKQSQRGAADSSTMNLIHSWGAPPLSLIFVLPDLGPCFLSAPPSTVLPIRKTPEAGTLLAL
jgi:hypothetical protein